MFSDMNMSTFLCSQTFFDHMIKYFPNIPGFNI